MMGYITAGSNKFEQAVKLHDEPGIGRPISVWPSLGY